MKLNLYHSALNRLSADKLIKDLANRNKEQKHIIITPDKSSLYYERKLFSLLNEDSFFDVTTTTLSRFANGVVGKADNILSKQGGVLIVKRILMENKSKLVSFNKSSDLVGFAGALFDTICMFKSCHILPDQIDDIKNETLNNKLKDIKLVYELYEDYLKNEYTDSFNRLNLCASKISKEEYKNVNFYFVGFQDFTKQGYLIIEKLLKCSNSVSVATTYGRKTDRKNNHNIYLNSVYYNCIDLANINGIECNKIEVENTLDDEKKFLSEQIYSNKQLSYIGKRNYVNLLKYNTIDDEVKNTILNIKYNIINSDLRFKNFAIVVSDLSKYKKKLIKYLDEINIEYFIDESMKLKDTMLSRFVSNIISILYKPTKYNLIKFIKSTLFDINIQEVDKYVTYVNKYEPQYDNLFMFDGVVGEYLKLIKKYCINNYSDSINILLNNVKELLRELKFEENIDNLMLNYYNNHDLGNYRLLKQSYVKINKIFDEINVLNDYNCNYLELGKFFDIFCENTSIAIPPIIADSVMVTSIDCENLSDIDYIYFLGFNEGNAPKFSVDSGIISDDEINKMPLKSRLNPTINVINKRLKFKLFELLFEANKKVIISYPSKSDDGDMYPNSLISNLQVIYGVDKIDNGSNYLDIINNNIVSFDENNFIYNNFSSEIAKDNYVELLKYWDNYCDNKSYVKTLSILDKIVGDKTYVDNLNFNNDIKNISKGLFLTKNKLGISEIERFNTCPYMHYIEYGLRLKPMEKNDLSALDLGNIIHEFVKLVVFRLDEEKVVNKLLNKILSKDEYKYLVENKNNNFVIKSLYEECERIKKVLSHQQSLSKFKVKHTELPFNMKVCNINGSDICLTGVVDRVDEFNGGIRIIDYKTGSVKFKNYEDIYYGNKLQVIVYLSALSKTNNLEPMGALYFPISNAFSSTISEDLYQMQGVVKNDINNILAFDKNLSNADYSSNIINLSTTSKGQISSSTYYKNMCLSGEDIDKLCKFVNNLVVDTIKSIENHIIEPFPIDEDTCSYCEYKGLCNFSLKYGNNYRKKDNKKSFDEVIGGQDE